MPGTGSKIGTNVMTPSSRSSLTALFHGLACKLTSVNAWPAGFPFCGMMTMWNAESALRSSWVNYHAQSIRIVTGSFYPLPEGHEGVGVRAYD